MNNPIQTLIDELKLAKSICNNEQRSFVYQNVIDRAEKLLVDQERLIKGVYLDGRFAALLAMADDQEPMSAAEYVNTKINKIPC